jgi:hypothetical protein
VARACCVEIHLDISLRDVWRSTVTPERRHEWRRATLAD